jgi:hypothetical protein
LVGTGSNQRHWFRIGRPRPVHARVRGRWSPAILFHGGAPPEFTNLGASGANSTQVWVRDGVRDMCNPPRASAGLCREWSGVRSGGGGTAVVRLTGVRVRTTPGLFSGRE